MALNKSLGLYPPPSLKTLLLRVIGEGPWVTARIERQNELEL